MVAVVTSDDSDANGHPDHTLRGTKLDDEHSKGQQSGLSCSLESPEPSPLSDT